MRTRLVWLDADLLAEAVELERDPLIAEMASGPDFARRVLASPAYAVVEGLELVAAGGLILYWAGRAEAWALVSRKATRRQIVEAIDHGRGVLDKRQRDPVYRRVEMHVRDEPYARSFGHALGFRLAGAETAWDPAGRDYLLFERIAGRA